MKRLRLFSDGIARNMFLHGLAICLCALMLALALLLAIRAKLYRTQYDLVIAESEERLDAGMVWFDSAAMMMATSSEMLCEMDDYVLLRRYAGVGTARLAVPIQRLRSYLLKIMLMCDSYVQNVYLLFPGNSLFISNFTTALDYHDVYPAFFRYEGVDAASWWNQTVRVEKTGMRIMPSAVLSSKYASRDFRCVTCVVHSLSEREVRAPGAVCFMLDEDALMHTFVGGELYEQGRIELVSQQGELLAVRGEASGDARDVMLTRRSADGSLTVIVVIPHGMIYDRVRSITGVIMTYICAGLFCLALLLSAVIAMYYIRAYRIVRISSQHTGKSFGGRGQRDYMDSAIQAIIQSKDQAERRLTLLQSTWNNETLLNVCMRGVLTSVERDKAQRLVGDVSERFAIALVEIGGESGEGERIVWAEEYMRAGEPSGLSLLQDGSSFAFIAPVHEAADHARLVDQVGRLNHLFRDRWSAEIYAGISEAHSGVEALHVAYDQAQLALRMHHMEKESPCALYGRDVIGENEPYISANMLSKLTDLMIIGESDEVSRLFDEFSAVGYGEDDSMYRYMYVFSAVRMAMLSASRVIVKNDVYHLPDYRADESIAEAFHRLKESALQLCDIACQRRRSNNTALLEAMREYVALHFPDANLSADQLAQHFGLSRSYVMQFVQMQLGKTLNDYIEDVRLDYVEQYLLSTDWPMDRIMAATGYVSQNTLYRAFKRKHGVTPGKWRERYESESG